MQLTSVSSFTAQANFGQNIGFHCNLAGRLERPVRIPVDLSVDCAAEEVYVLVGDNQGEARMLHQLVKIAPGRWGLKLYLPSGTYRYRYYASERDVTRYLPPDEVEDRPVRMCSADAILEVRPRRTRRVSPMS